jgi:hypothetical protein
VSAVDATRDADEQDAQQGMQWALGSVLDTRDDVVLKNLQLISGCAARLSLIIATCS